MNAYWWFPWPRRGLQQILEYVRIPHQISEVLRTLCCCPSGAEEALLASAAYVLAIYAHERASDRVHPSARAWRLADLGRRRAVDPGRRRHRRGGRRRS